MTERGKKYLSDVVLAINLIEEFGQEIASFTEYINDTKTQSAIERQLVIVGEAINKFQKECPDEQLEYSKQIIGFRNRIVHAYDSIDHAIVWVIIKKHLTPLLNEIQPKLS